MNLNHLRVFVAVADEGSVTAAARRLHISQPAVSKQLNELEQALNVELCDRFPRGVRLTDAGRVLRDYAHQLFAIESAAEADLAALITGDRGRLSVGASTTIGSYLIPELFGVYKRQHPGVTLELQIANTQAIQAALLEGSIDVALTEGFVPPSTLEVEVVGHDEMKLIVAPDHPWVARKRIRVTDLTRVPVIMRERGSGTRDVIEAALGERGITIEPAMSLGSTEAIKNAVAAGLGVAIVSELALSLELAAGRLVELPVEGLAIHRALHSMRLRGSRERPQSAAFLALLRARAAVNPPRSP